MDHIINLRLSNKAQMVMNLIVSLLQSNQVQMEMD